MSRKCQIQRWTWDCLLAVIPNNLRHIQNPHIHRKDTSKSFYDLVKWQLIIPTLSWAARARSSHPRAGAVLCVLNEVVSLAFYWRFIFHFTIILLSCSLPHFMSRGAGISIHLCKHLQDTFKTGRGTTSRPCAVHAALFLLLVNFIATLWNSANASKRLNNSVAGIQVMWWNHFHSPRRFCGVELQKFKFNGQFWAGIFLRAGS